MKKIILFIVAALMSLSMLVEIAAQTTAKDSAIVSSIRLQNLQAQKESLQKEIKIQDSKRNQQISGVSAEALEDMNDRQDSLCLALRSELVDVILEIKELSPGIDSPQLINQYTNLVHRQDSMASAQPTKPTNTVQKEAKK
jgi:hypothetical protein